MPIAIGAAFPALWPALAILLVLYAVTILFQRPLVMLLQKLPVVGTQVADAVGGAINTTLGWAQAWAAGMVRPLLEIVRVPLEVARQFAEQVAHTFEVIGSELSRISAVAAGAVGSVADRLARLILTVASLTNLLATARKAIDALSDRIARIVADTIPDAVAGLRAWARALVSSAIAAAVAPITEAIKAARAFAQALVTTATATLTKALEAVRAALLAAVAVAVREVNLRTDGLLRPITDAIGGILGRLGALEGLLPLLALLPLVRAIPLTIERFWRDKRECVDPMCSAITPRLDLLNALTDGAMLLLMLELVRDAVSDPEGVAQSTASVAGELRGLVDDVTGAALGISL